MSCRVTNAAICPTCRVPFDLVPRILHLTCVVEQTQAASAEGVLLHTAEQRAVVDTPRNMQAGVHFGWILVCR